MTTTHQSLEEFTLDLETSSEIRADLATVWDAVLLQLGPESLTPDGTRLDLTLEPFVGGRWFRDMGEGTGHLWGHVQVYKPCSLLEICGPMFMSYPVSGHIACSLEERGETTAVTLRHRAFGLIEAEHKEGVREGWRLWLDQIRARSERVE